jgi:hypothetical protein
MFMSRGWGRRHSWFGPRDASERHFSAKFLIWGRRLPWILDRPNAPKISSPCPLFRKTADGGLGNTAFAVVPLRRRGTEDGAAGLLESLRSACSGPVTCINIALQELFICSRRACAASDDHNVGMTDYGY